MRNLSILVLGMLWYIAMHSMSGGFSVDVVSREVDETDVIILSQLPEITGDEIQKTAEIDNADAMPIPQDLCVPGDNKNIQVSVPSPESVQGIYQPIEASPVPSISFQALNDNLTVIPPDTQGVVGVAHVMTTLNDRVRIQTKEGAVVYTTSLRAFWGTTSSVFDPKITYDPYSNRWIFVALSNPRSSSSMIFVAVSQTDDPLGIWYIKRIKADSTATPTSGIWADFPSVGFNSKWIAVQVNMFAISNNTFNRSHIYVFNKQDLYNNGNGYKLFSSSSIGGTQVPACTYDIAHPNLYLLQNWNGSARSNGVLRLYALSGTVGNEVLSSVAFVSVSNTWASSHPIINKGFAPQSGTVYRIMNNDARMLSVVFRNGSIWAAHTVFLPTASPTHSAIQWWQISSTGAVQQFGRIEDTAATLDIGDYYAFPSIAVNTRNDVLIGYSRFNAAFHPSAGYSFRYGNDLVNTLRGSVFLKNGLATYIKDFGSGRIRWGDYSSTAVDPNQLDLWTLQEYADTHASGDVSRWATWWGKITPLLSL